MASVTWGLVHGMLRHCWTGSLFGFASLDTGFLIGTDDPDALLEQGRSLFVDVKHRPGTREKLLRLLDMLPGMEAPGTDLLGGEPAPNGSGRNGRQGRESGCRAGEFPSTPVSQRHAMRARQTTR